MIQWVYEAALKSEVSSRIVVATPDLEIARVAEKFGAEVAMTRPTHPSGTDRLAEVAEHVDAETFVNVQGDEPLIDPATIRACADCLVGTGAQMGSIFSLCSPEEEVSAAVVKVVTDLQGYALYFSRFAIPFPRSARVEPSKKHVGIYSFKRNTLLEFATWPPSSLERSENLEQLRFLEHGVRIKMAYGQGSAIGVDTPEQAEEADRILSQKPS